MGTIQSNPPIPEEQEQCGCYGGYHYIGIEEDGEETYEAIPCKRCSA